MDLIESLKAADNPDNYYLGNNIIQFKKAQNSSLNCVGKVLQSIINSYWNFYKMDIDGLGSRPFSEEHSLRDFFLPKLVTQMGCEHVKDILLYGPPGTDETLMAWQVANMRNAREPKIVMGFWISTLMRM